MLTRRQWLANSGASASLLLTTPRRALAGWPRDPFSLGVASGYPTPGSVVLWTRLAPEPYAPGGGMDPVPVAVRWEVAEDERFEKLAGSGITWADPGWGHSVHVEVPNLAPDRWYHYRFHAGDASSATGRTRTAPGYRDDNARLRFGCASCQHFEHGYYAAYRHMLDDDLDLVLHLGDYIYEGSWGKNNVRSHEQHGEPVSLDDYRARYARYRSDADLRAAHAACPWLVTWDDHEVDNDYAGAVSQDNDVEAWFLARRAAAYQAYYEHMPLPRRMLPAGPYLPLYTAVSFGRLARFYLLDDRQYRSPQPCPRPGRSGGNRIGESCEARLDPHASMLGQRQEAWFDAALGRSKSSWNVIAQQTLIADADGKPGPGKEYYSDGWSGYPAARDRLLDAIRTSGADNPVAFGGDVHAFWAADLKADFADPGSATVASEFVTSSISSNPAPSGIVEKVLAENPHLRFGAGGPRGYLRVEIDADAMTTDMREVDDVRRRDSGCRTLKTFRVTAGRAGVEPA